MADRSQISTNMPTMPTMSTVVLAAKGVLLGAVGLVVTAVKALVSFKPSIVSIAETIIALKGLVTAVKDLVTAVKDLIAAIKGVWDSVQAGQLSWAQGWQICTTIGLDSLLLLIPTSTLLIQSPAQSNRNLLVLPGPAACSVSCSTVAWVVLYHTRSNQYIYNNTSLNCGPASIYQV